MARKNLQQSGATHEAIPLSSGSSGRDHGGFAAINSRKEALPSGNEAASTTSTKDSKEDRMTTTTLTLLAWTDKQGHILTGGGVSSKWYKAPRFPFSEDELPHFHKARGSTREVFAEWVRQVTIIGNQEKNK